MVHGEVTLTLRGIDHPLLYSGRADWELKELLCGRDLLDMLTCRTAEDFYLSWRAAGVLSRCHSVASRGLGEIPGPLLIPDEWIHVVTPEETMTMAAAVARAVKLGFAREHRKGPVDKGLAALQKKRGEHTTYAQYLRCGIVNGLSPAQTLDLTPGVLYDLWELYLDATGRRKKED